MAGRTYVFAGPPGSANILTAIIEAALGQIVIHEPGSDPYVRADSVAVYISGHDFDDGDIDAPDGTAVALRTGYPHMADVRDIQRNDQRQHDVAAQIFSAIKADGRLNAVHVDDMQYVMEITRPRLDRPG